MRFWSMVGQASIQTARPSGPSTMERSSGLPPAFGIQAPWPRPGGREIEPNKAEHDGGMPLVQPRQKAVWGVAQQLRGAHLARDDEGDRLGEKSEQQEEEMGRP